MCIRTDLEYADTGDGTITVIDPDAGQIYRLDTIGASFLSAWQSTRPWETSVTILAESFGQPPGRIRTDGQRLWNDWASAGLIEPCRRQEALCHP
ncbi:hypothetical protein [Haloglycomyces albus]|uniref:hypothetical protein n=1 Tax=Haloglycomyces albus TaxID=526067 RepID=UPI00046CC285|nr:hypothetical protein [Haloglycomyces albus]